VKKRLDEEERKADRIRAVEKERSSTGCSEQVSKAAVAVRRRSEDDRNARPEAIGAPATAAATLPRRERRGRGPPREGRVDRDLRAEEAATSPAGHGLGEKTRGVVEDESTRVRRSAAIGIRSARP
jgi:hypothetical protein